jgi:hypothetical protein
LRESWQTIQTWAKKRTMLTITKDMVVEDAASMPDGCLGVIVIMFAVASYLVLKL